MLRSTAVGFRERATRFVVGHWLEIVILGVLAVLFQVTDLENQADRDGGGRPGAGDGLRPAVRSATTGSGAQPVAGAVIVPGTSGVRDGPLLGPTAVGPNN